MDKKQMEMFVNDLSADEMRAITLDSVVGNVDLITEYNEIMELAIEAASSGKRSVRVGPIKSLLRSRLAIKGFRVIMVEAGKINEITW